MPLKKKKTRVKTTSKKTRAKHPEKLDLRLAGKHKKPAAAMAEKTVNGSMARLKQPGEDKLKKQERKRREREITRKIREIERRGTKEARKIKSKSKKVAEPSPLIERDKRLIMYIGVSFFMVLIAFFWVLNMKQVFKQTTANSQANNTFTEFDQLGRGLSEALAEIKNGVREIKSEINATTTDNEVENKSISTSTQPIVQDKLFLSHKKILELKQRLEELEEN